MGTIISYLICSVGVATLVIGFIYFKKNSKRFTNRVFFLSSLCSFIWSLCFGLLFAQTDVTSAWLLRCFGMIGVFGLLSLGIVLVNNLVNPPKTISYSTTIFGFMGFILYPFVNAKESQTYMLTKYGMAYSFENNLWFKLYTLYSIGVMLIYLVLLIMMLKKADIKREKVYARKLLFYAIIIFIGSIFDTIMPMIGFLSFPGSTIAQGIGLFFIYDALMFNDKNSVSTENIDNYIFHSSRFPILVFDHNKKLSMYSDSAYTFLNGKNDLSMNEMFKSDYDILDREDKDLLKEYVCLINGKICQLSVEREYDKYGDIISYVVIVFDITEKNKMIDEIESARLNAENASKAKEKFLANISHEIRTPLNAILGTNEVISKENDIITIRNYCKNIEDAGASLLSIIDDILNFTKIETGELEIVNGEYNPEEIINSSIAVSENKAKLKNLVINKDISNLPNYIIGDKNRIGLILINLIDNAIKFTEKGSIYIKASSENVDSTHINLVLQVSDSGIGIEQDKIDGIFTSFKELEENMFRTTSGVGLGLAIVKKLVTLMHGIITVNSIPGKGTTFLIKIPSEVVIKEEEKEEVKENTKINVQRNLRIINIDDNKMNLLVFKRLLKNDNIEVDIAQSGKEGLEMVKSNDYDVIFLDHMMPEMDGVETLGYIREYEQSIDKKIPVVVLTANAVEGAKDDYIELGFDDYIAKPTNRNQIIDSINKFINE